jgi:tryptophanyl-tRNA synthetase
MSKSDPDSGSCIYINDPPDILREKVKKSVTDSIREVHYDPVNRPGKKINEFISDIF